MKYLILTVLLFSGCASKTQYGDCVGFNGTKDSKLSYQYSARNIAVGIVFFEFVAPPIIVALSELECPVGTK